MEIKNKSECHIDCMAQIADLSSPPWRFTGFYGAPKAKNRHHSWRFLRTLYTVQHGAWLCMGDFNEVLHGSEQFSRSARPEWQMRAFREAVGDCGFQDLRWSRVAYTWDNRQAGDANVKARLDRGFANAEFMYRFEHTWVRHISFAESDHCLVLVEPRDQLNSQSRRQPKSFRYENVWQTHTDYDRVVSEAWQNGPNGPGLAGLVDSLNNIQSDLGSWGSREFGSLAKTVKTLRQKLDRIRRQSVGRGPSDEEKRTMLKLREALQQEEIWMRQRSRVQWLREWDRNTASLRISTLRQPNVNE